MKKENGYGTISNLGKKRRKPFAVRITTGYKDDGTIIRKYIGYFETRKEATLFLAEYNEDKTIASTMTLDKTFKEWSKTKYPNISSKSQAMYNNAWNKLSALKDMDIKTIKTAHLQKIINQYSNLSTSSLKDVKSLSSQLYDYAIMNDYATKNYARYIELKKEDKKEKEIFSKEQINTLWSKVNEPWVDSILFMIYTGMRVGEMLTLTKFNLNKDNWTIQHGIKTDAGKNRIIPIHSSLIPLLEKRLKSNTEYIFSKEGTNVTVDHYRKQIYYPLLVKLNIPVSLTPHSCRHTFASRLSNSVENKVLIQKLMGHTDYSITANIYTHSDILDLQKAIESVK